MGTRAVPVTSAASAVVVPGESNFAAVMRLLEDLARLSEDKESADVVFLLGREETPVYAHRIIMQARCKNFSVGKRTGSAGNPTPIRMPHAHPETFRRFIHYIYTGKIILEDSGIFEMLGLAQEMGVEELWQSCEEHVSMTLSPGNACTLLSAALDAQERVLGGTGACSSFIEKCFAYIGENAIDTVKTNAFCNLPKDAVIKLISSDYLGLEEEDVWRAVLNWAKYQAGVTQPTQHWTEEERARVCQYLAGVINHVRLLLIDSQVFAEEVEPTGAVPIELSLERYRIAALPKKHADNCSDKRLQPRVGPFLFPGSQILSKDKIGFQRLLNQWYGVPKQSWRLQYRASSHGYTASTFHKYCDGVSPTYVICLGPRGQICGGFSDIPWGKTSTKVHHYIPSDRAFLFTLINDQDVAPTKFDVVKKPFAICYHPDIGPIFGAGADLLISSNCNMNMDSYSNLPHSYEGENASNAILMGDYYFSVVDYEVFTLSNVSGKSSH
ncbi:kelch-like protein 17 [Phymastichus coffea]|uniref:kelch-like protein 17 n=1 Tax=Phymastichus coffea TaxID=108790 RepID=UPI00273CB1FE|nr:kelch-like protein 17 [Phymastichus coffea]